MSYSAAIAASQQGVSERLAITAARLDEATNWHQFSEEHDEDGWCCKREQELRDEIMALRAAQPAAVPVESLCTHRLQIDKQHDLWVSCSLLSGHEGRHSWSHAPEAIASKVESGSREEEK